jgi:hypothetical protein
MWQSNSCCTRTNSIVSIVNSCKSRRHPRRPLFASSSTEFILKKAWDRC